MIFGYKRASNGLDLISNSKLNPIIKMELLMQWREPYVSKKSYKLLVETINTLEKKPKNLAVKEYK